MERESQDFESEFRYIGERNTRRKRRTKDKQRNNVKYAGGEFSIGSCGWPMSSENTLYIIVRYTCIGQ